MPFRSPTKPIHFTKEIENLRGGNGMPRFFHYFLNDFKAKGCIAEVLTVLLTPILSYDISVICHMSSLTYDINGKICHITASIYDI